MPGVALGFRTQNFPAVRIADGEQDLPGRRRANEDSRVRAANHGSPAMTALPIRESVNQTVDNMGFQTALQACSTIHQLDHSQWAERNDGLAIATPSDGIVGWKEAGPVVLAERNHVRGAQPDVESGMAARAGATVPALP